MRTQVLLFILAMVAATGWAQNINDNKIGFGYIQLPLIKINDAFTQYEVRIEHSYAKANEDSLALHEVRKNAAAQQFEIENIRYKRAHDSLVRIHLAQMASWEKQVNSSATTSSGGAIPQPTPPVFPQPPAYPDIPPLTLHSEVDEAAFRNGMEIGGFEKGLGGFIVNVDILPLRDIRIEGRKKGSRANTRYEYTCNYILPIQVKVESPTQGTVLETLLMDTPQSYELPKQSSSYDHLLYMLERKETFFTELEKSAREKAFAFLNAYLNDQIGYVNKQRNTEIYSVKRFKDYDYTDVTNAYTATVHALSLIQVDRDWSSAQSKLAEAMKMWEEIMMESNTYDGKARINDKITAMIQCNIAEIQFWQKKFNEADATLNLVLNSGVLKGKSHARDAGSFYDEMEKRWKANY